MTISKTMQHTDTKKILIGSALKAGITEYAAEHIAEQLEQDGYKVVKMTAEELNEHKEQMMQKNQMRVQPEKPKPAPVEQGDGKAMEAAAKIASGLKTTTK